MAERWTADSAPIEAYDREREQRQRAEKLLAEIRDGKHSIPGALVQIRRYFENRGKGLKADAHLPQPQQAPGEALDA